MTETTTEGKQVYKSLAVVLKDLSVEKNGRLPGNMGNGAYVKASDLSEEVKKQFTRNNLILLPMETLEKHEVIHHKEKLVIATTVRGVYTILSTEDDSHLVVAGTGDGLATGAAVSTNIASTNALKNALLRTFLVTETSVEDAGKEGVPNTPSPTAKKVEAARQPKPKADNSEREAQQTIKKNFIDTGKLTTDEANERKKAIQNAGSKTPLVDLLAELEAGK